YYLWIREPTNGAFRARFVSIVRSRLLPSISGALTRQFADRPLKGAGERRAIRFREPCVSVPVQRDAPELPYETSSVGLRPQIRSGRTSLHEPPNLSMDIRKWTLIFRHHLQRIVSREP